MDALELEARIRSFLYDAIDEAQPVSDDVIEEFGELCKSVFKKHFCTKRESGFTLRMSNIGKPSCQLLFEKEGATREAPTYSYKMKMFTGDLLEAAVHAIIKSAGIKAEAFQIPVKLEIHDTTSTPELLGTISGTLDEILYEKVYDIKSTSVHAYQSKFSQEYKGGFESLSFNDDFGYVPQLFGYAHAVGRDPGGWIALCKETGEICVTPAKNDPETKDKVYQTIVDNYKLVTAGRVGEPAAARKFTPKAEIQKKQPTGNILLPQDCNFCEFRFTCWPTLTLRPKHGSKAFNPPIAQYLYVQETNVDVVEESERAESTETGSG